MHKKQLQTKKTLPSWQHRAYCFFALLTASLMPLPAQAEVYDPDTASSRCRSLMDSVDNLRKLENDSEALQAIKRCIDLGIDPPTRTRPDGGTSPAAGVPKVQLPSRTCPPFSTCLYSARVNAPPPVVTLGGEASDLPIQSVYTAPQFYGHLPDPIPPHLVNGATIYFVGKNNKITAPKDSLVYPTHSTNFYADGKRITVSETHILTPPAPEGKIMEQKPVILHQQTHLNFDDSGIIVLAEGYAGKIGDQEIVAGDLVYISHSAEMWLPPKTKLYPYPMGSNPEGVHRSSPVWEAYRGPRIQEPQNMIVIEGDDKPGKVVWWREVPIEGEEETVLRQIRPLTFPHWIPQAIRVLLKAPIATDTDKISHCCEGEASASPFS